MSIGENMCQAFQKEKVSVSASKVRFAPDKQAAVNHRQVLRTKEKSPSFIEGRRIWEGLF